MWFNNQTRPALLLVCGKLVFQGIMEHPEEGFARAKVKIIHKYSCYSPLSSILVEYEDMLGSLVSIELK